jgi:hypothetical protein
MPIAKMIGSDGDALRRSTVGRRFAAGVELAAGDPDRLAMLNDDEKSRDQAKATNPLCWLQPDRTQL